MYLTSGPVAEQGLLGARELYGIEAQRIADLGTGAGVFGQRAKHVWPAAGRFGFEIRSAEHFAARHYDAGFHVGNYFAQDARRELRRWRPDLIVSNPPYTRARDTLALSLEEVSPRGHVLLLLRSTFGGSEDDDEQLRRTPPLDEWSIPGRLRLKRGTGRTGRPLGGDFVGHIFMLFRAGRQGRPTPVWQRRLLPPLPSAWLGWTVRPGDEHEVEPLPREFWPRKEVGRG
ncbi:methyltransferase [Nannocystis exedens]|uniref:methyltransferase n=1 Tax=Nannocystis exedens TaxID=54 RepID=UPI000BBA03E3|nr:methyltransferase [Nannocystis exedens]